MKKKNVYSNILEYLYRIPFGTLLMFVGICLLAFPIYFAVKFDNMRLIAILELITLFTGFWFILLGIHVMLFKLNFKNSGFVYEGNSKIEPIKTKRYMKGMMRMNFILIPCYVILGVVFFFLHHFAFLLSGFGAFIIAILCYLGARKIQIDLENNEY